MSKQPLMPMATAVWLVDNTTLTFDQIARFCGLHALEVQGIADGTVAVRMVGHDPVKNGQLTAEEIKRCEEDSSADLELLDSAVPTQKRTKGPRYTPVSKRKNKPDAIAWLVRNHPELSDGQIGRLIGTTKTTIEAVR
ncbi:MAG: cell cycle transcriptional regulator TrcR, partial [Pseudomonadota bacterium]